MFSEQEILAALLQFQSGEMPETTSTSEPVPGYSGGTATVNAIQEAPIIMQQPQVSGKSAVRENNGVDNLGIRYVFETI